MIDDISTPSRRKQKVIAPPEQPKALPSFEEAVAIEQGTAPDAPVVEAPRVITDRPPEPIEPAITEPQPGSGIIVDGKEMPKRAPARRLRLGWPPSRLQLIAGASLFIIILGGSGAAWALTHRSLPASSTTKVTHHTFASKVVTPKTVASTLSGLQVDASVNQRPVTGVMIENSDDARPQSGLDQASVVFEAIAEGGITRFLTLFQDTQPDYLGPVRSARPYYVQWCMGFDCSLAHVGGSPEALSDIKLWGTKDLDQFANGGSYQRISSRYAPHNVYTSMDQLNQLEAGKGFGASSFTGFARKAEQAYKAPAASTATSQSKTTTKTAADNRTPASTIDMAISGYDYNTHYDYDAASNSYKRSEGGAPHMSLHKDGSQVQITPKVVIAMIMQYGLEADDHHSQYNVIGNGQAYIFQDGTVTKGTWSKADMKSQITFADESGKPVALDPGQTWLTALAAANQISYK